MKALPIRLPSRGILIKFFILFIIVTLFANTGWFMSSSRKIKNQFKSFEEISEQERAELLGLDDGITDETRRVMNILNITNAGENGEPVEFNASHNDYIKKLGKMLRDTYKYNALASSMVSLNRALPDNRSEYCKSKKYPKDLPKASVVIPFHDDDWMLLMRNIHSVLLRTPDHLLEEILLVFDYSTREYYQERLDEYIKKYPKIRLIRSHRRQGIIPTRILGGRNAIGPVIVYLDSHVEVTPGWIEPMLARINENPTVLAWAKISGIDPETMKVTLDKKPGKIGVFRWDMYFEFMSIRYFEGNKPTPRFEPKPTVTMIGPCFAIRKDFFHKIGLFDPDFDYWGGEDVELALRTWMCGGRVELIPCTVIAHMFKAHTYTMATKEKGGVYYNHDRTAETWMDDEYKKHYYTATKRTKPRNFGDITERLELKKKLGCKSFKWLLENVYPLMPIPTNETNLTDFWYKKRDEGMKKLDTESNYNNDE